MNVSKPSLKNLRIAFLTDWFLPRVGGMEIHQKNLALELSKRGHWVEVITGTKGEPVEYGIPVHRTTAPTFPHFDFIYRPKSFQEIQKYLMDGNYDVVHVHASVFSPTAFGGAFISQKLGLPTLITFHSLLGPFRHVMQVLHQVWEVEKWPVLYTAVSQVAAENVQKLITHHPIHVLPNGVHPQDWEMPLRKNTSQNHLVVTTVMRLTRKKRAKALVQILKRLIQRLPQGKTIQLNIVGDGPDRLSLEKLAESLHVKPYTRFYGYQPRDTIRKIFQETDLFVLPSELESFGIAALEARTAGLPILAMAKSGVREFVRDGIEGFLVQNYKEMEDRILELICHPERLQKIAGHNQSKGSAFTWNDVIEYHHDHYEKAIKVMEVARQQNPSRFAKSLSPLRQAS